MSSRIAPGATVYANSLGDAKVYTAFSYDRYLTLHFCCQLDRLGCQSFPTIMMRLVPLLGSRRPGNVFQRRRTYSVEPHGRFSRVMVHMTDMGRGPTCQVTQIKLPLVSQLSVPSGSADPMADGSGPGHPAMIDFDGEGNHRYVLHYTCPTFLGFRSECGVRVTDAGKAMAHTQICVVASICHTF